MGRLFALIGIPRSGKSTFCNDWLSKRISVLKPLGIVSSYRKPHNITDYDGIVYHENMGEQTPRVLVCADKIRLSMGHRWNSNVEDYVSAVKNTMIKTLLQDHDTICDGTHTTIGSIKKLLTLDPDAQFVLIDTPVEVCKQRAIATGQEDLLPVIDRMAKQLDSIRDGLLDGSLLQKLRAEVMELKKYDRIV